MGRVPILRHLSLQRPWWETWLSGPARVPSQYTSGGDPLQLESCGEQSSLSAEESVGEAEAYDSGTRGYMRVRGGLV